MAAASTFSYAQAAKGKGAPTSNTTPEQAEQAQPADSSVKPASSDQALTESTETSSAPEPRQPSTEKLEHDSTSFPESSVPAETTRDSSRAETRRDEEVSRLDRPWRRADKGATRSSSATTRSVDESESRRPRKGRKSKPSDKANGDDQTAAEKQAEPEPEQPKIELTEAAIPSVNIWQQRKETLLAKVKPTPSAAPVAKVNGLASHGDRAETAAKSAPAASESPRETVPTNGAKPARKTVDGPRTERPARGSRAADKVNKDGKIEIPPPVEDAVAWPTPETAIKEHKKPADAADKSDKDHQEDAAQGKAKPKDKWVTYDYVPTVTFETQLPGSHGPKSRGGAKGAGGRRGGHSGGSAADKSAPSSGPAAAKTGEPRERHREPANGVSRTPSVTPASKRGSVDLTQVAKEARKPAASAAAEKKEAAPATQPVETPAPREVRSERGRGGYRGRGGHHSSNSHVQSHGGSMQGPNFTPNGNMGPRGQPYSPPPRGGHGSMYGGPPPPQRGGRGGRNNAGSNWNRMSLPNGASRPPPVQTQFAPYEYPMPPMSAMTYQAAPYWDHMVLSMLKQQLEYYFSIENLCKDLFLRRRMDSQGFVPLHFILSFQRVRDMQVDLAMVRAVCEESTELDYVVGEDDCERLRRRHGWESWTVPFEERDPAAQNHGPMHPTFKNRNYGVGGHFNGMGSPPMHFPMGSPHAFSAPPEQTYAPFGNGHMGPPVGQDSASGKRFNTTGSSGSQLSANVPDFSPSNGFMGGDQATSTTNGQTSHEQTSTVNGHGEAGLPNGLTNGVHAAEQPSDATTQA